MPGKIRIWVFFGLIATGKSTLAEKWAARHELAYCNSDRIRKALAGLAPTAGQKASLDKGIYSGEFSRRTYDVLLSRAEEECAAGRSVVLDASYQKRAERDRVQSLARRVAAETVFVFCTSPEEEIMRRLAIRQQDPEAVSDGRPEIYRVQKERFEYPDELDDKQLFTLSTEKGNPDELLAELDRILEVN